MTFIFQQCSMKFQMRTATAAKVHFVPTDLIYSGPIDMTEFSLANYTVQDSIDSMERECSP